MYVGTNLGFFSPKKEAATARGFSFFVDGCANMIVFLVRGGGRAKSSKLLGAQMANILET